MLPIQGKARLSPVQMNRSRTIKTQRSKEFSSSVEEENENHDVEQDDTNQNGEIISTTNGSKRSENADDEEGRKKENENEEESEHNENGSGNLNESERKGNTNRTSTKTTKTKQESLEKVSRFKDESPYNQSVENLSLKRQKRVIRAHQRGATYPAGTNKTRAESEGWNNSTKVEEPRNPSTSTAITKKSNHSRTASQPQFTGKMKYDNPLFEKVRHAKEVAESAIRNKRVFICHGPYPIVRAALRRRGYVEKHYSPLIKAKKGKNKNNESDDDDSCDSGDDSDENPSPNGSPRGKENNSKPLARTKANGNKRNSKSNGGKKDDDGSSSDDSSCSEDDDDDDDDSEDEDWKAGYEGGGPNSEFNLMSRMVRNANASFIWTIRRDDVDFKFLRKDQTVNHFSRAYSFTTKVGICINLRNLAFYEEDDQLSFFPRCHRLGVEEDKLDFIDDFRLCSAISIIKWVLSRYHDGPDIQTNLPSIKTTENENTTSQRGTPVDAERRLVELAKGNVLPVKALTLSLEACREFLRCREHFDIDDSLDKKPVISDNEWDQIIEFSYQLRQQGSLVANAFPFYQECQSIFNKLREHLPQCDIDGQRNIWIVKPGAKSRGRGITCMDRLEDILKLTGNIVGQKEGRWVVQKYIERPLLIYKVKFDIRQWFLVTDWNPLTIWFYQDCYLRFCSQNFSLEDFHVSIHLANNSVQKNYENDKVRDKRLPDENMWSSDDFKAYLNKKDLGDIWDNVIYPGMKKAVIYAVKSCQEIVEYRKNSFELYGADFIITDDYKPWLIEINCSPTMGASTGVTRKLCAQVVEDTMRVVLDRREDKNCDTGRFELAYKQPLISAPPYIGVNLAVEGQGIRKHGGQVRRASSSAKSTTLSRPRDMKNVLNDSTEENQRQKREYSKLQSSSTRSLEKKSEGTWATGSSGQLQAPTVEEKISKLMPARNRNGNHGDVKGNSQTRVSRPMTIPKAVLRYSTDSNNNMQRNSQLPISIGPDH
ncbi:protein monoglycylase TTLL8-like isoform X2 [Actinia tenebrosa]|nr:protein monoglycylase TTLL8-like isoform X2 [Actinia tenebrosa]